MQQENDQVVSKKDLRNFGLIMAGMFILIFGLLIPWIWSAASYPRWPWIVAAVFAVLGLATPAVLSPVYRIWMKIGHVLGWINTRIILGVVFYGMFMPMGFVMRLLGKDPMARKFDKNAKTYRVASKPPAADHLEKPF